MISLTKYRSLTNMLNYCDQQIDKCTQEIDLLSDELKKHTDDENNIYRINNELEQQKGMRRAFIIVKLKLRHERI